MRILFMVLLVSLFVAAGASASANGDEWTRTGESDWSRCSLNEDTKCGFRDGSQDRTITYERYDLVCPEGYEDNGENCKKQVCWYDWFKKKCKYEYADKVQVVAETKTETEEQSCQVADEDVQACEKEVIVEKEVVKEVPTVIEKIVEVVKKEIKRPSLSLSQGPNGVEGDQMFQVEWKKIKDADGKTCKDVTIAVSKSKTFGKDGIKKSTANDGAYTFTGKSHSKYYVKIKGKNCGEESWSKTKSIRP